LLPTDIEVLFITRSAPKLIEKLLIVVFVAVLPILIDIEFIEVLDTASVKIAAEAGFDKTLDTDLLFVII